MPKPRSLAPDISVDAGERIHLPAAEMTVQLGFCRIRPLTNTPQNAAALSRCAIPVETPVPQALPANRGNEFHLAAKAARFGHHF